MLQLFDPDRLIGCVVYSPASMDNYHEVETPGPAAVEDRAVRTGAGSASALRAANRGCNRCSRRGQVRQGKLVQARSQHVPNSSLASLLYNTWLSEIPHGIVDYAGADLSIIVV